MFRDEAKIEVSAGRGGDGLVSFRREAHVPRGGPDGGDGGDGGDVVLVASDSETSLLRIGRRYRYSARSGQPGGPAKRSGRSGDDLIVEVPVGTQVYDAERGNLLRDLSEPGQRLVVAKGGRGGHGNVRFANSVRQVPRVAKRGLDGEHRMVKLELKLFAQVGLLGLPNAGKSTFLSAVTAARPRIADYPFTTLQPQVGIAEVGDFETLVIADLPGLIEGAAEGQGLGHRFLKHVERCRILMHLVDCATADADEAVEAWRALRSELERFSGGLAEKPSLLVASKVESEEAEGVARALEEAAGRPVLRMSAHTRRGVPEVLHAALREVQGAAPGL